MRIVIGILFIFSSLLYAVTCKSNKDGDFGNNSDIVITDAAGRQVTISRTSKFITTISQTEIFRILDAESRVAGVNRWVGHLNADENPVLSKLPVIGGFSPGDVNYEMIFKIANESSEEDVVLTYNQIWADDIEKKVGNSDKIKVIKLNLFGSDEPQKEIAILGKALRKEAECERYLKWFDSLFILVKDRVMRIPENNKLKVYWDASGQGHYDTSGKNSSAEKIISNAGGIMLSGHFPQSTRTVSPEWIMQENPGIILSHASNIRHNTDIRFGYGAVNIDTTRLFENWSALVSVPGISMTDAAREKKVYFISDDLMFGPSQPVGVVLLAKLFYPDIFEDINIRELLKHYYENFMRLEYKGFYLYPTTVIL
jgi:iron complex transport system substrate-binding protein